MGLLRGMRDGQNYQVNSCALSPRTDLAIDVFKYLHVTAMDGNVAPSLLTTRHGQRRAIFGLYCDHSYRVPHRLRQCGHTRYSDS